MSRRSSSAACWPQRPRRRKHDNLQTLQTTSRGIAWRADGPADRARPAAARLARARPPTSGGRNSQPLSRTLSGHSARHARARPVGRRPPGLCALDDLGADALSVLDAAGVERVAGVRRLARRHDGDVARRPRARIESARSSPSAPALKIGAAIDVGRAHPSGSRRRHRIDRRRVDGTLVHRTVPRRASRRRIAGAGRCWPDARPMATSAAVRSLMDADLHAAAQRIVAPTHRDRRPRGSGHATGECAGNRRPHRRRAAPDAGCLAYLRRRTAAGIQRRGAHVSRS